MHQHNRTVSLNDNPDTPGYDDGCAPIVVTAVACALILAWRLLITHSGYAQLSDEETHEYALKVQREWHWSGYTEAERRAILDRVERLIARNPRGYLARIAKQVYR